MNLRHKLADWLMLLHTLRAYIFAVFARTRAWARTDRFVKVPLTAKELDAWFNRAFRCEECPAERAYYERSQTGELCRSDNIETIGKCIHHVYQVHGFACINTTGAEARLCQALYDEFKDLAFLGYRLVWRRHVIFDTYIERLDEKGFECYESMTNGPLARIAARFCIEECEVHCRNFKSYWPDGMPHRYI